MSTALFRTFSYYCYYGCLLNVSIIVPAVDNHVRVSTVCCSIPLPSLFSEFPFPLPKRNKRTKNCDTCPSAAIVCLELSAQFNAFMAMKARKEETKINKCAASCLHASGFPNDSSSYKAAYVVLLQTIVSPGAVAMVSRFIHGTLAHLRALFFHVMSGCLFFFFRWQYNGAIGSRSRTISSDCANVLLR